MSFFLQALFAFAWCPVCAYMWVPADRARHRRSRFLRDWLLMGGCGLAIGAVTLFWPYAAGCGASFLLALAVWWWRRRKDRKRSLKALGAKSRARLAALVRNMPRPVPRLRVPEGMPA